MAVAITGLLLVTVTVPSGSITLTLPVAPTATVIASGFTASPAKLGSAAQNNNVNRMSRNEGVK